MRMLARGAEHSAISTLHSVTSLTHKLFRGYMLLSADRSASEMIIHPLHPLPQTLRLDDPIPGPALPVIFFPLGMNSRRQVDQQGAPQGVRVGCRERAQGRQLLLTSLAHSHSQPA